jgi:hypothetical protein
MRFRQNHGLLIEAGTRRLPMPTPHIVIVGADFGGLTAATKLAGVDADVTVVDRRSYHLFQPLLYQVATAGLSPAQIASPIRAILRSAANVGVLLGRVTGVDKEHRTVDVEGRALGYDYWFWRPARDTPISVMTNGRAWRRHSRRSRMPPTSAAASWAPSRMPKPSTRTTPAAGSSPSW